MKVAIGPIEGHYGGAAQHILNVIRYSDYDFDKIELPIYLKSWGKFFRKFVIPIQKKLPHSIEHNEKRFDMYGLQKIIDVHGFYLSRFKLPSYDVVHLHGYPYWELLYKVSSQNLVYTLHNLYNKKDFPQNWSKTLDILTSKLIETCKRAKTVISVAKWLQRDLKSKYGIESVFIPNGVSLDELDNANGNRFRNKYGINDDFYLFVGRLTKYKRPELFISLAKRMPNRRFVMIGRGLSEETVKEYTIEEIPPNLLCIEEPSREYVVDAFDACRTFVLPSSNETFGIVLLEAMARGKSVVAADNLGPSEIIDNGITGMLFEPDNLESLVKMASIAWDNEEIGLASREKVKSKYDWKLIVHKIEGVYEKVK